MRYLYIIFLVCFAVMFMSCGQDTESRDDVPPQQPNMVPRSDDAIYPQAGVRPEPTLTDRNYWTRIEWFRNPEDDLSGYRVRRWAENTSSSEAPIVADLALDVQLPDNFVLFWIDRGNDQFGDPANLLAPDDQGITHGFWWQVQAYDTADNRSEWSDSVYYRMIYNPYNLSVQGTGNDTQIMWNYPIGGSSTYLSFYKIRVYSQWYGVDSLIWDYDVQLYESSNALTIGVNGAFTPMTHDCTYVWQLNAISYAASETNDLPLAGSAMYTTFTYQE